ncbi:DUF4442 domain-containing protein [soil metagenome]
MSNTKFQKLVNNSFLFRIYLLKSLPMAYIAGIRVKELSDEKAITTVKFGWLTQNPFRSMYFACQAMAAEMSTGLLVMNAIYNSSPAVSMLIVENKAIFHKKAIGKITFTCNDGNHIAEMIAKVKQGGEGISSDLKSIGLDEQGDMVAEFIFTWSLKAKSR